ncbi:hypothetical protein LUX01_01870 [Streptomyces sudanensis]|uniref:hypothetical protein n=1 Tax=Streptomyces sudanensis TaxID=436397 RepID=UPI0020CEE8D0|nr:hypothetical protein [Streptomyces sudanensis]MCP9985632.1 hypothetical protein [Streptomyces sudanensis]
MGTSSGIRPWTSSRGTAAHWPRKDSSRHAWARLLSPTSEPAMPGVRRKTTTLTAISAYVTQGSRRAGFAS